MPHIRSSRRLSHPVPKHLPLLDVPLPSPASSACTDSPPAIVTHLPFAPGSSHTRNRKEGHIPRPPNAFMVFRSWLWNKDNLKSIERDNRNVSRIAGRYWNELSEAERAPFRTMAEEAKARHAQLYPQYRYSPTSQKKPKVSQRRSQRAPQVESEKCNKVVDLLLANGNPRNLPRRIDDEHDVQPQGALAEQPSSDLPGVVPRNGLKRPAAPSPPPQPRSKKQKTLPPSPFVPTPCPPSLPVFPAPEESAEVTPMPGPPTRTPELMFPAVGDFVPTDEIPFLSLDSRSDLTVKPCHDDDLSAFFPSHMKPATHTVFSGIKPEATSFVDSCMLGAYNADALVQPAPLPFTNFDLDPYSSLGPSFIRFGSPVFSNPFELSMPTAEQLALLDTLDQLFGQPISPLSTAFFPAENW